MNDIFLSYDRSDRERAHKYADVLESAGWSVFWDREIPLGENFDQVIEQELNRSHCVIVLWSTQSIQSRWVKTEASAAAETDRLVPVLIDQVAIPFEFRRIQTAELWDWNGHPDHPEFVRLLAAVREKAGAAPAARATPARPPARGNISPFPVSRTPQRPKWIFAIAAVLVLFVVVKVLQWVGSTTSPDAADPQATAGNSPAPSTGASAGGAAPGAASAISVAGALPINIGDKIDDGVPAAGAGVIEQPYSFDHYVFSATAGQTVYFRMAGHSPGLAYVRWKLTDEDGQEIFKVCLGCSEVGVQRLNRGGRYVLSVGSDEDASTGTYRLQLFNVPPPTRATVKIGEVINGDVETPGSADIYTFSAQPRQRVYFRMFQQSPGLQYVKWRLVDENEMEIFNLCLGCSEPGAHTLIRGGTYTLTVENKTDPSTGTYRAQLFDVPSSETIVMKLGEKRSGSIETPGAEDVYTFNAAAGQRAFFRMTERAPSTTYLKWRLEDENGMEVFNLCLGCSDPAVQTLTRGGKYTLTVGNSKDPSTGTYTFETGLR